MLEREGERDERQRQRDYREKVRSDREVGKRGVGKKRGKEERG